MLELRKVGKRYRKKGQIFPALDDISLTISQGDYLLINGPSGAGKSTLLNIIGGLVQPDSGTVIFRGKSLYNLSTKEQNLYRKIKIGFVFQQFHLMPYLSVIDNIRLACNQKKHREKISDYLEKCSLTELKGKYPSNLSVGEKQRVAFIRAIISEPEILLADEPTGNLDEINSRILMDLISDFHRNGGTVIVVSHNPGIAKYAGNKIDLEKGRIVLNQGQV